MEKAIKKAIEGGWKKHFYFSHFNDNEVALGDNRKDSENNPCFYIDKHQILLDPLFWQALGKINPKKCWACNGTGYFLPDTFNQETDRECGNCNKTGLQERNWEEDWHDFIDHLIEGKNIDDFFNNLLTK